MKIKILVIIFLSFAVNLIAQNKSVDSISYAHIKIKVPLEYQAKSEFEVGNKSFSAQWLYLTQEMFDQNLQGEFMKQFAGQTNAKEIADISFISKGGKFTGKKFIIKGSSPLKYRIMASGVVNNQPLFLNLGFENEPSSKSTFDHFVQNFIQWEDRNSR